MIDLFLAGGVLFWSIVGIWIASCFWFVVRDNGIRATIVTLLALVAIQAWSKVSLVDMVKTNLAYLPIVIVAYAAIGAMWSLIKWFMLQNKLIDKREDAKRKWLTVKGLKRFIDIASHHWVVNLRSNIEKGTSYSAGKSGEIERERDQKELNDIQRWIETCQEIISSANDEFITPRVELKDPWEYYCKKEALSHPYLIKPELRSDDFFRWMFWWPISFVITMLNDPIVRLYKWMYKKVSILAIKIRDWKWKKVDDDFKYISPPPKSK